MLLENKLRGDKNLMLQDGGGSCNNPGDNPNDGDCKDNGSGRLPHRVVKQKKRSGKTASGGDKATVREESDSDMSDREFQFVEAVVDGRTAAKDLGARPARPTPQDVDRATCGSVT